MVDKRPTLVSSFVQSLFSYRCSWLSSHGFPWGFQLRVWTEQEQLSQVPPRHKPKVTLLLYFRNCHCLTRKQRGFWKLLHSKADSDRCSFWSMRLVNAILSKACLHMPGLEQGRGGQLELPDLTCVNNRVNSYRAIYHCPTLDKKLCPTQSLFHVRALPCFIPTAMLWGSKKKLSSSVPFYRWKNWGLETLRNLPTVILTAQ